MSFRKVSAVVLLTVLSCDMVVCTFKSAKISSPSQPMLASIFTVAEKVRQIQDAGNNGPSKDPNVLPGNTGIKTGLLNGGKGAFDITASVAAAFTSDMLCRLCQKKNDIECIKKHCWNSDLSPTVEGNLPQLGNIKNEGKTEFDFRSQLDRHDILINTGLRQPETGVLMQQIPDGGIPVIPETGGRTAPVWSMVEPQGPAGGNMGPLWTMVEATIPDGLNGGSQAWLPADNTPITLSEKQRPADIVAVRLGESSVAAKPLVNQGNAQDSISSTISVVPVGMTPPEQNMQGEVLTVPTDFLRQLVDSSAQLDSLLPNPINSRNTGVVSETPVEQPLKPGTGVMFPDGFVNSPVDTQVPAVHVDATRNREIAVATDIFFGSDASGGIPNRHALVLKTHGNVQQVGIVDTSQPLVADNIQLLETPGHTVLQTNPIPNTAAVPPAVDQFVHTQNSKSVDKNNQSSSNVAGSMDVLHDLMNTMLRDGSGRNSVVLSTTTPTPTMDPRRREELQKWARQLLKLP